MGEECKMVGCCEWPEMVGEQSTGPVKSFADGAHNLVF